MKRKNRIKLAIIMAMNQEARYALDDFKPFKRKNVYRHKRSGTLLFVSGVGKANAAETTAVAVFKFGANRIINLGTCGLVSEDPKRLKPGDVALIGEAGYFDTDVTEFGYAPGELPGFTLPASADGLATASLIRVLPDFDNLPGVENTYTLGTGDVFVTKANVDDYPAIRFQKFDVLDMEGAAIAHSCRRLNVGFGCAKVVSDRVETESNEEKFLSSMDACALKLGRMARLLAEGRVRRGR